MLLNELDFIDPKEWAPSPLGGNYNRLSKAIGEIMNLFLQEMGTYVDLSQEGVEINEERDRGLTIRTFYLYKYKRLGRWLYLRKKVVRRVILRIFTYFQPAKLVPDNSGNRNSFFGTVQSVKIVDAVRSMKCELFIADQKLNDIVSRVLDPLAAELGYGQVKYVDAFESKLAWYSGEHPRLPNAQLIKH